MCRYWLVFDLHKESVAPSIVMSETRPLLVRSGHMSLIIFCPVGAQNSI